MTDELRQRYLAEFATGDSDRVIGERMGRDPSVVWKARRRLGLPTRLELKRARALPHVLAGRLTDADIQRSLGFDDSFIWRQRVRLGLPPARPRQFCGGMRSEVAA